jgi:hypothetical protein
MKYKMKYILIFLLLFYAFTGFIHPEILIATEGEWRVEKCCGMKKIKSSLKSYRLKGVWGSSSENVFVVGSSMSDSSRRGGIILHYNGIEWQIMKEVGYKLNCVWGTSANHVFVGGGKPDESIILGYDGTDWSRMEFKPGPGHKPKLLSIKKQKASFKGGVPIESIWGSSEDNVFAVARQYGGLIFHFDGQRWEKMNSDKSPYLNDISGNSKHNIYAVGSAGSGNMMYYDGISWTPLRKGEFNSVWCSKFGVVFTAGKKGNILRYNSENWDETDLEVIIYDIYGIASNDVYAVGKDGFIFHFDGSDWREMYSPVEKHLHAVWADLDKQMFAVGDNGIILRFGESPSPIATPEEAPQKDTAEENSEQTAEVETDLTYEIRLKDGRRIITKMHWEEGDVIYYHKFGTTVGLPKTDVKGIFVVE